MSNEPTIMIDFPIWLIVILVIICVHISLVLYLYSRKEQRIKAISELPDEMKIKIRGLYLKSIKLLKISFWVMPLNVTFIPYVFYKLFPEYFFQAVVVIFFSYFAVAASYLYKRAMLHGVET